MAHGIEGPKQKKRPWKTRIERDIKFSEDIKESSIQGGKVIGNNLALLSFIIGIPLLLIGLFSLFNLLFGQWSTINTAIIIAILLVNTIGIVLVIGGYFLSHWIVILL